MNKSYKLGCKIFIFMILLTFSLCLCHVGDGTGWNLAGKELVLQWD